MKHHNIEMANTRNAAKFKDMENDGYPISKFQNVLSTTHTIVNSRTPTNLNYKQRDSFQVELD